MCASHCPACQVVPINPKTPLGLPWSNRTPRRRKPLPVLRQDWQPVPIPALCPLSKRAAPNPARLPRPPTHSTTTTKTIMARWRKKRAAEKVQFRPRSWPVTRGTASLRRPMQRVRTRPLVAGARPAPRAPGARARSGRHLAPRSRRRVATVSLVSSGAPFVFIHLAKCHFVQKRRDTFNLSSIYRHLTS